MIELDEWQKEFLNHKGDKLLCTGRRVGKTFIMAVGAVERMIEKPKTKVIIFSTTEEQSMLILAMAKSYLESRAKRLMSKKKTETNLRTIKLKNGSIMRCRPAGDTGDSGRGFEADILIVDEAARMSKFFWLAVRPIILMTAGVLWLSSTPFGKQGYFWEMFNESQNLNLENARFKVFHKTTEQVIRERKLTSEWTENKRDKILRILEADKRTMTRLEYGQEYEGLFMEDLQQFFPDEMIMECQTLERPQKIEPHRKYYMGQDVARMGEDQTTFEIGYLQVDRRGDAEIIQVENLVTKKTFLSDTFKSNLELDKLYNFKKIFMDDEGLGVGVFDMMMDNPRLRNKTVGVNNSKKVIDGEGKLKGILKTELYYLLRSLMETKKIHLLKDHNIFQSLKSVQYEYSVNSQGIPIIKIHGNDTHITEGLIRLSLAIKEKSLNLFAY